jgi:hypothetical protein
MNRRGLLLVALAVAVAGSVLCFRDTGGPYADQIRKLRNADIEAEVGEALASGDARFVAVLSDGLDVPGVPPELAPVSSTSYRVIPNTTDATESSEHRRLQEVARRYAEKYNRVLMAKRR